MARSTSSYSITMRVRDSIIVRADAGAVWQYVADPALQAKWNPKIVSVDRAQSGPAGLGDRFEMTYRMSGENRRSSVEVTECEEWSRIVFQHCLSWKMKEMIAAEAYDIVPHRDGVKIVQTIDLSRAGIPRIFLPLIWFLTRFGRSVGESDLHHLKRLVEDGAEAT